MVVRRTRNRVNNASLSAAQARLKAAINNSLAAYMKNAASPANLANVNRATRNLIRVYVENASANVKPPNGNGGNKPLALPAPGNANKGNANTSPLNAGTNLFNGGTKSQNMKVNFSTKLGMMTSPNEKTYLSLNAMKKSVTANPNLGNQRNVMLRQIANKKTELNKKSANILTNFQGRINAAKNGSELNTIVKNISARRSNLSGRNSNALLTKLREKRGQFANAANAKATANKAAANAAKAANAAAKNAAEANAVAKKITASAIASAIEKQKAVNNRAAANAAAAKAAANAKAAAKLRAQTRFQGLVGKAAEAEKGRGSRLLNVAATAKAAQAQKFANLKALIERPGGFTSTERNVVPLVEKINANNILNNSQKETLKRLIGNKRYAKVRANINEAKGYPNPARKLLNIETQLKKNTGKYLTNAQKTEALQMIKNLKDPGPSSNVPKNGGPNNNMNKLSLSQLNAIIRLTKARLNKGQGANGNKNRLARATKLANALRSKKKGGGLFGAIGGIARGVGGAAIGGVKAAGGAAKYVAAGTVHHATQAVKAAAPYVKVGVRYNGQKKAPKKIPNTKIGNNNINRKAFNAGFGNEPWARQL